MDTFKVKRLIAVILSVLFVSLLGFYVIDGIRSMDNERQIYMTGYKEPEDSKLTDDEVAAIVDTLANSSLKHYIAGLLFLIAVYCILTVLNIHYHMEMQGFLTALFMLLSIGLSYKVLFPGFTGLFGEASFTCISVLIAIIVAVIWRSVLHHQVSNALFIAISVGIIVLLIINMFAPETYGAKGWIKIAGISIQPAEIIKGLLVVLGACSYRNQNRSIVYCAICLISAAVMVLIKDLGAAAVLLATFVLMSYLLFDNRILSIGIIVCGCLCMTAIIAVNPHALGRIADWGKAMTNTYTVQQKNFITQCIAGGWKGLGLNDAYHFTRLTAAKNDAAVAGIMSIYGLGMVMITIGCYCTLILCSAYHSSLVHSNHLVLFQMATILFVQVLLNFAGSLDVIPFTGVTAPSLSTGGSSTLVMGVLYGLMAGSLYPSVKNRKLIFKRGKAYAQ